MTRADHKEQDPASRPFFANTDIRWQQHTLKDAVVFEGRGLHSGLKVIMTVMPAEPHSGIVFVRRDVDDIDNLVSARWNWVSDTELSTTISNGLGVRVSTTEHLMAALFAAGIDNARIVIDAPEVPILDGSAHLFLQAFEQTGMVAQNAERQVLVVEQAIEIEHNGAKAMLSPSLTPLMDMAIDFDNEVIGHQHISLPMDHHHFKQVAKARTFGFKHHLVQLKRKGLARGSSLNNAILIDDNKVVNRDGLRYQDEFVRHKFLDAIGDLAMAGHIIVGHFQGLKSGHRLNNELLRKLFASRSWRLCPISEAHTRWAAYHSTLNTNKSVSA